MVIAGIAAFIEAHSHAPKYGCEKAVCLPSEPEVLLSGHLSQTPYDVLRIGAWALLVLGALTVILGLIRYVRPVR